jgi:hypothetical protein
VLRPIVLFGTTPAARARETGVPERTLRRRADRFDALGMVSLFEAPAPPSAADRRALPADIRQTIADLKAEYPPLGLREIATICEHRFHRPVGHHTVQRVLASGLTPTVTSRRFPRYRDIADPVERRLAVVRLYLEGWNIKSIAGYLATPRQRVYEVLRRWFRAGRHLPQPAYLPAHSGAAPGARRGPAAGERGTRATAPPLRGDATPPDLVGRYPLH